MVHLEECSKKVFLAAKIYPLQINTSQDGTGECCLHSDPKHCTYIYRYPPSSTDTPSNYKSPDRVSTSRSKQASIDSQRCWVELHYSHAQRLS